MNPREQVFAWMRTENVGCQFAMLLGKDRETYRKCWYAVEVANGSDAAEMTRSVMPNALTDPQIEAALYVFKVLHGADDVVDLVNDLCVDPLWSYSVVEKLRKAAPPAAVPISLVLEMPWLTGHPCNFAEVIGLGDFDPMPPTRRAPFIAIGFRNGRKVTPNANRPEINLCDIPMEMSQSAFDRTMRRSSGLRAEALGNYPADAAKAQLTFMLPESAAERLR